MAKRLTHSAEELDSAVAQAAENSEYIAELRSSLDEKVDKQEGKGLSANDYTTADKEKLAGLENYDDTELRAELEERISPLLYNNAGAHNSVYRGKSLGTSVTSAQYAAISAGTFEGLYIGDYWTIDEVNYRIAAFDYYLNCGDTNTTAHHAVLIPDTNLYTHVMNDTNTTEGAYVGSKMYTEGLEQAKTIIKAAFSGHVLSHRVYLTNAVTDGHPSAGAWCDSEVELMNEHMVYGNGVFSPVSDGAAVPNNYRVEKGQLPLFALEPSRICNRASWWLRDVITASRFARVHNSGNAHYGDASDVCGVRPAFCIS